MGTYRQLQVVDPYCVVVKNGTLLVGHKSTDKSPDHVSASLIRFDSEQTYRPVGAEKEAVRAEQHECLLGIRAQRGLVDFPAEDFGDHAGNFHAEDVLTSREFGHAGFPRWIDMAFLDFRLGDVVDDDAEIGLAIY